MSGFDIVVVGCGPAGAAAACAAADNGAKVMVVDANPFPGGELVSGLPVDGCLNARGEWIVGGPAVALFDGCKRRNGYIGPLFDWRLNWGVCVDPVAMRLSVLEELARRGVCLRLGAIVSGVEVADGRIVSVDAVSRQGKERIPAEAFVDASGDAALAVLAGVPCDQPHVRDLQPVSLTFRVCNVNIRELMLFVRDHPEEFLLAESPVIDKSPAECSQALYDRGLPFVPLSSGGCILGKAVANGVVAPCTAAFMWPTSMSRKEIGFNMTRLACVDATGNAAWSDSLPKLAVQVEKSIAFMKADVPGFADALLSDMAYSVGIRETRRIRGEAVLDEDSILGACRSPEGIARGAHHIDVHGSGTAQTRIPVKNGGSYDIPFGCLLPVGIWNLIVAGRCISSTRRANGSCRVMGTCLAMGQAAGTAAAFMGSRNLADTRQIDVNNLRVMLMAQGAVLEGPA